jgi:hypothetical protein
MKQIFTALAMVTVVSLCAAGCGDDDDSSGNTAGSGNGNAGAPSNNEAGAAPSNNAGAPASGNVMCDETQDGVCQNPRDCPFVVDGTARITAGTCGQGCVGDSDENCSRDCITKELDMSSECAKCYADTVNCTIMNCLGQCIQDPEADACKQCQVEKGCRAAFDECSGLPG